MKDQTRLSVCTMDCPDTCSLEVEIKDGKITGIGASDLNPTTQGFICTKVSRFARRVYSDERVLYPMKRTGAKGKGEFERMSWEEAVQLICDRFKHIKKTFGGEAILPYSYGGSNGILGQHTSDRAFFAKLGASQLARTVCAAPTTEAAKGLYGKMPGTAFEDYEYAKFILIWGANPKASNIHLMPFLKKAKKNGAKIAVVDPYNNFSNKEVDLHLPVYPGTDLVVALALIRIWHERNWLDRDFLENHTKNADVLLERAKEYPVARAAEISQVEAAAIEKLAEAYALHDPAVVRVGWGLERNRNGGQAAAAILSMPALLGKFGMQGSGYTMSNSGAYKVDGDALVDAQQWNTRVINMNHLGRVLLNENDPPIKGLFVYNCNPAATVPNQNAILQGLARDDLFTIVFEQVMTDTAKYADVLLPAVTFLEQKELKKAYGAYALQYLEPVIEAMGEAKPNEEVFALLGRTMGWKDDAFFEDTEDYLKRALQATKGLNGELKLEKMAEERIAFFDFPGRRPIQFKTVFPETADGKVDLAPPQLGNAPYEYIELHDRDYPLAMISPATDKMISSTMGEFNFPELYVAMHPEDAAARSLKKGETVRVFNSYGEVVVPVRIDSRVGRGVAMMPKGAWRKSSLNGLTATALAPDTISEVGGGACFNDARVEVEAA